MDKIKEEVKKRKKAIITVLGVGLASIVSYRLGYRRGFDHAIDNIIVENNTTYFKF